jgi:HAD superfamily hydrolase (TIGR01490 family)
MRKIAFFDFDGTLTLKDSSRLCSVPSIKLGLLSLRDALGIACAFFAYKLRLYPRHKAHLLAFKPFTGNAQGHIERCIQILHDEVVSKWYSASMKERVAFHKNRGDLLVIATASFNLFPKPLAQSWGFDAIIGTELGFQRDICDGKIIGAVVENEEKLRLAQTFAKTHQVDLKDCSFYSDNFLDLPLMEAVGQAVAVGPCRRLRRIATERQWEIIEQTRLCEPN